MRAAAIALLITLSACHGKTGPAAVETPVPVRVAAVTDKARTSNEEVVGTVRPKLTPAESLV